MTTRRALALVALLIAATFVATVGPAGAQADDIPDACRTIIGCADAGPKPESPGDRGGYAQLLTLAVLAGGVGFIGLKVTKAVRDGDRRTLDPPG